MELLLIGGIVLLCVICVAGISVFWYMHSTQDPGNDQLLVPRAQALTLQRIQSNVQGKKPEVAAAAIRNGLPGFSIVTFYGKDPQFYAKFDAWDEGKSGLLRTVAIIVGDDGTVASLTFGPTRGKGWWDGTINNGEPAPQA